MDYLKINSNDQLDLIGQCLTGCGSSNDILTYNYTIYTLLSNQWTPFTNILANYLIQFNSDLTVFSSLFQDYPIDTIWKIELATTLIYNNGNQAEKGLTSVIVYVNHPPKHGSCAVSPTIGTTNTLFSLNCTNWIDNDGSVVNYAFYGKILFSIKESDFS